MGWITEESWLNFQQGQNVFLSFRASKPGFLALSPPHSMDNGSSFAQG